LPNPKPILAICLFFFLTGVVKVLAQSSSERARNELQLGVDEYQQGRYDKAVQHFQLALAADPESKDARMYLATSLGNQCLPGVKSPENDVYCGNAIALYRQILDRDPDDLTALKAMAAVYFNQAKLDEAKDYQRKVMTLEAKKGKEDAETPYMIAIIDWSQAYKRLTEAREEAKLQSDAPFIAQPACPGLRSANLATVEEGMRMLNTAMELRPDYDDAMAYMNLMYQQRAEIQCGDQAAASADVKSGGEWLTRMMEVKRKKQTRPQ
jgi:tetratricopeptide (TPR) repeat protein